MSENNTLIDMAVVVGYDEVKSLLNIKFMCEECEQESTYAFYLYDKKEAKAIIKLPYTKNNSVTIEAPNIDADIFIRGFLKPTNISSPVTVNSEPLTLKKKKSYDLAHWKEPIYNFKTHQELQNFSLKDGIYHIHIKDDLYMDLYLKNLDCLDRHRSVFVNFNAAVSNRKNKTAPFFSGMNVSQKLGFPIISISDPSFSMVEESMVCWYAGNKVTVDLIAEIAKVLEIFSSKLNKKFIIFGGSAGGFATISILDYLTIDCVGVAVNPQINLAHYPEHAVRSYLNEAFDDSKLDSLALEDVLKGLQIKYNLSKSSNHRKSKLLYLQNQDDWHIKRHCKSYLKSANVIKVNKTSYSDNQKTYIWCGDWGKGHAPIPINILEEILKYLNRSDDVMNLLSTLDKTYAKQEFTLEM